MAEHYGPLGGTLTVEESGVGQLKTSMGVLSSLCGAGRHHKEMQADSVVYNGAMFRRR